MEVLTRPNFYFYAFLETSNRATPQIIQIRDFIFFQLVCGVYVKTILQIANWICQ